MTKTLRASSIAASLALLSFSTMAAAVTLPTITFEDQAQRVIDLGAPVLANSTSELGISNAWVYAVGMTIDLDNDVSPPVGTTGAYVTNRDRNPQGLNPITLELLAAAGSPVAGKAASAVALDNFLTSITFDVFSKGLLELFVYDDSDALVESPELTDSGLTLWSTATRTYAADQRVSRVEFRGGAGVVFGLDNVAVAVSQAASGGGGGAVPEPASYALVAFALLAASGVSRQRKA